MTAAQSDHRSTGNDISDTLRSDITLCYPCPSKSSRLGTTQTVRGGAADLRSSLVPNSRDRESARTA